VTSEQRALLPALGSNKPIGNVERLTLAGRSGSLDRG